MINIAIDGPSGAGKSTIAKHLAKTLGFLYVDTGALYRAIGLYVLRQGEDTRDEDTVEKLLEDIQLRLRMRREPSECCSTARMCRRRFAPRRWRWRLPTYRPCPCVREFLFSLQQNMALHNNVVMDGRDIGTVVLPNAQIKIFLTATAEDRARRRCLELKEKGQRAEYETVLEEVKTARLQRQPPRLAPLKKRRTLLRWTPPATRWKLR